MSNKALNSQNAFLPMILLALVIKWMITLIKRLTNLIKSGSLREK